MKYVSSYRQFNFLNKLICILFIIFQFGFVGLLFYVLAFAFTYGQPAVENDAGNPRLERQAGGGGGHHDAVDFGAHTGDHGAFGWYADFPVHTGH